MIYYQIDSIHSTYKCDLSDSALKPFESFTLNSRISKIVKSSHPSEVVTFCSQFDNNISSKTALNNINPKNGLDQQNSFYSEGDIIEIIHSIDVAEKNLLLEKEFNSIINYFVMKEISPTLIENYTTPNLRRLKTDILFFSQVEAQLQNYQPIQFDLQHFYVSKRDIGVQSPKHLSKSFRNNLNFNNKSTFLNHSYNAQTNDYTFTNKFEDAKLQNKQEIRFLSESDTENNNDIFDKNKDNSDQLDYEISNSIESNSNIINADSSSCFSNKKSRSYYNFKIRGENSKKKSLKRKSVHRHNRHHNSKNSNAQEYHHSKNQKLMEIKQESSSELKIERKNNNNMPKIFQLNMEDSVNTIVDSSSNLESISYNDDTKNIIKSFNNEISKFATEDDCFEIEFENESEIEDD